MNCLSRSFIIVFSEAIWMYYTIAFFTSVEMDKAVFVPVTWWLIAGIAGYVFNRLLAGRVHYLFLISGNILLLIWILIQNLQVVNEGTWVLGFVLSIAVSYVFIRSGSFVYREPTRMQILNRFEGNIILYALFALVFTAKGWTNGQFHVVFLFATFISLMGMTLTLQKHVQDQGSEHIEVQRVGQSGWFTAVISILLTGVALVCTLLFLPSIREMLYTVGTNGFGLLKWLGKTLMDLIAWFFSLFPPPEIEGAPPEMEPEAAMIPGEMDEDIVLNIPIEWLIGIGGTLVVIVLLIVFTKFLKQWQPPKMKKRQRVSTLRASWWTNFWSKLKTYLKRFTMKWKSMFPQFYKQTVYWYYAQVEKWGRKNGIPRLKSETSGEYVEKIIQHLVGEDTFKVESLLRKINQDYQAAYYGEKRRDSASDYQSLLKELKSLELKV